MMKNLLLEILFVIFVSVSGLSAEAQERAIPGTQAGVNVSPGRVIGEVATINPEARQLTIKTDKGDLISVKFDESASFKRVPPGVKTLEQAVAITFAEIGVGDRIFASGSGGDDGKSVTARVLIVVSQADLTKKHERDREEWRQRGIVGTIATLDAVKNELTVVARLPEGKKPMVVTPTANVKIRRYAAGSVKFNEARPSVLTEFKAGDQVRALGTRNAEGTTFSAEEIVGGTFRVVPGVITAVNPASGEILVKDLQSQQALTIAVNADTLLRRLPAELLARLSPGAASSATAGQSQPASANMGGNVDVREALERQPPVPASELKVGDMAIIISTSGTDPARLTAITFITGVDSLLQPLQTLAQTPAPNRRPSSLNLGLPEGLSSLGIGLP
jgi:hypothetical protein